jgi:hypothetical protein
MGIGTEFSQSLTDTFFRQQLVFLAGALQWRYGQWWPRCRPFDRASAAVLSAARRARPGWNRRVIRIRTRRDRGGKKPLTIKRIGEGLLPFPVPWAWAR